MNQGVLYLMHGTSPAARLVVSAWSLRKWYAGRIAVVSTDAAAEDVCRRIATDSHLGIEHIPLRLQRTTQRNWGTVIKSMANQLSPFKKSVFLDCDTLVRGDIAAFFDLPSDEHIAVTRFSNWSSTQPIVRRRIRSWMDICPELVPPALQFGIAINTGTFAFSSQSRVFEKWFSLASAGADKFIPDEIALQLLVPHYPTVVFDQRYNCSAKFGAPRDEKTVIVHFHGKKHIGRYGALWTEAFEEIASENIAGVRDWAPAGDHRLQAYLEHSARMSS